MCHVSTSQICENGGLLLLLLEWHLDANITSALRLTEVHLLDHKDKYGKGS